MWRSIINSKIVASSFLRKHIIETFFKKTIIISAAVFFLKKFFFFSWIEVYTWAPENRSSLEVYWDQLSKGINSWLAKTISLIYCKKVMNENIKELRKKSPWGRMLLVMLMSSREKSASCFFITSFAFISTTCLGKIKKTFWKYLMVNDDVSKKNLMLCWTRLKTAFFPIQLRGPRPWRPTYVKPTLWEANKKWSHLHFWIKMIKNLSQFSRQGLQKKVINEVFHCSIIAPDGN